MTRKTFHVCSYGGCGSKMLCQALRKHGLVTHVHTRKPPVKLTEVRGEYFHHRWIPEDEIENHVVIYIYKNPIKSLFSRHLNKSARRNIQVENPEKGLEDIVRDKVDYCDFEGFYRNYTTPNPERNYKIICVKYEEIFDRQDELSEMLGIGPLDLVRNETDRVYEHMETLMEIFGPLIEEMEKNDFIMVI